MNKKNLSMHTICILTKNKSISNNAAAMIADSAFIAVSYNLGFGVSAQVTREI